MSRTTAELNATLARIEEAQKEGRALSHREAYPEQYSDPLVGKTVRVVTKGQERIRGRVERVVGSRFGKLAHIEGDDKNFWSVSDCQVTD